MDIGIAGFAEKEIMDQGRRPPPLVEPQRRAQRLPHDAPRSALVSKCVTPSAGARKMAVRIPTQRNRPGPGYSHDPRSCFMGAGQRDSHVIGHQHAPAANYLTQNRLLAFRAATESETGPFKFDVRCGLACLGAGSGESIGHRADQTRASLCPANMVRLAANTLSQNAA